LLGLQATAISEEINMSLPKVSVMWEKYPRGAKAEVASLVGGSIGWDINHDSSYNTCCIRTSRALNLSGAPIEKSFCDGLKNKYVPPKVRTDTGSDKKFFYIPSVLDMRVYLEARYGLPTRFNKMSKADLIKENTGPGILMFFQPHCDLWDGTQVRYNDGEWDKAVQELLLWSTPAEDPVVTPT
jgi:Type VI secretion system (T6SS), amidase effector protein 4